jgi:hypothetical protein
MPDVRFLDAQDIEVREADVYRTRYARPRRLMREGIPFDASSQDDSGVWIYRSRFPWPYHEEPANAQFVLAPDGTEGERFTVAMTSGRPPASIDRDGHACPLWGVSHSVYQYFVSEDTT